MTHGCKRAGGFVDSGCCALCDCHETLAVADPARETFVIHNPDGSVSLDAYAGKSREELKERCRDLVSAVDDWQFAAMFAATDGANTIDNVREPYRLKISRMIEAYSDEPIALPSTDSADSLRAERDAALEQARRDREYTASQTGESVQLVNQVIALTSERDEWRQAAGVEAGLRREFLTRAEMAEAERDALALQVAILTNERDNAVAARSAT